MDNEKRPNEKTALDVLFALKDNVMRSLNVAEVAQVIDVANEIYTCKFLNSETRIRTIKIMNVDIQKDDIVLIAFANTNFSNNLAKIKNDKTVVKNNEDSNHSIQNGIIIGLVYRKEV